jgi:hypothetical protein
MHLPGVRVGAQLFADEVLDRVAERVTSRASGRGVDHGTVVCEFVVIDLPGAGLIRADSMGGTSHRPWPLVMLREPQPRSRAF